MKVALLTLCIGAVMFLLRVLVALAKEGLNWPQTLNTVHFATFHSSRQRGELIQMDPETRQRPSMQVGKRMAR
jgi:hypothetical protein